MYPMPVAKWKPFNRRLYKLTLPVALLIWLLPMIAVLVTSVRSTEELSEGNYWGWPKHITLIDNYREALTTSPMLHYFWNSVLITVPAVIGSIALAAMAGFALAIYKFRGNTTLFATFVAGNFVPVQILMIPVRDLSLSLGVFNTLGALILFHVSFQTGFCALFLRNFIKQLPYELVEAARIEGASEWTVFFRIVLPLIRPALAALAILVFTFVWNDYFWALCLTQGDDAAPITVGVAALKGQWTTAWNLVSAGSILAALPSVAMFFAMQKHFVAGLTFGATKG
ncbi:MULTISPECIES: carbohydrate ABC transporter permease [Paraburkholderia]|jgi:multiple sugar transport system permease protein|uniref:Binding-protein-dependent transport systems inner membrane component n=1 Tax=Paraburkholderia hospita TaxID=169430 RepID=A0AAJ4VWV6_9BURK|nr:carbohydrate ABC transporter permease [Paraburkholderia hospita]EUC14661.1 ABC-type transporter, integral membrane subunit [Burkholderia sp. BT03]SKC82103.1 carbohydrate ABC transporter membrane protein 2, CUT1 family [Burkholderia sp. CF099]SOE63970.1 carbohydrate ABC transporter membrane protein 2, CUT1 family [Burkholderia sp. YR290]AUT69326.1 carbohydrate ABC transporter permease [Paraburkholderia hospita]EIM96516.1 binding-protein-dependent transport systems inner membrane component [P